MNYTRLILILAILALVSLGIPIGESLYQSYEKSSPAPSSRSNNDFTYALRAQKPELFTTDNQPIFTISKTIKVADGWYLLQLSSKDDSHLYSYVVANDQYRGRQYIHITSGPNSSFSTIELLNAGISSSVAQNIIKDTDVKSN